MVPHDNLKTRSAGRSQKSHLSPAIVEKAFLTALRFFPAMFMTATGITAQGRDYVALLVAAIGDETVCAVVAMEVGRGRTARLHRDVSGLPHKCLSGC